MSKTIWLLDVDGVLNASDPGWPLVPEQLSSRGRPVREVPKSGFAYAGGTEWKMRWSYTLMQRLRKIANSGLVEIRWSTTWCGDTDGLERLFGLPHFDSAWEVRPDGGYVGDLKWETAKAVIDEGNRLIWTDDAEVPLFGSRCWKELTRNDTALLISPAPRKGLQPEHFDEIERFIGYKE